MKDAIVRTDEGELFSVTWGGLSINSKPANLTSDRLDSPSQIPV